MSRGKDGLYKRDGILAFRYKDLILKKAKLWHRLNDDYRPLKTKASDIGRALSREQLRHLAEVAAKRKDWEAAFYGSVLAANTGLRGGEIKKLRIGCVDLERRQLRIVRTEAKSDAGARWIELNADATEAAARLLMRARELGSTSADDYVMPKHLSRIMHGVHKGERGYDPNQHQEYWDSAWTSLTDDAGLTGFRFHDLRHTFITQMVERGVPIGLIQAMVGHLSARMLRHYTHVSSGAARKAVEIFDAESILIPAMPEQRIYQA
jgi:integrase